LSKISLAPNASGTGNFTIASPNGNTDRTLTLPDNTGTVLTTASTFGGTGPAFSAYRNTTQSISNASFTKVQCDTEEFDTNTNYDNATNYRFTPTVAGYYQVNGSVAGASAYAQLLASIYKNGSEFKRGNQAGSAGAYLFQAAVSALIYLNGSTDYVELYAYQQSGGSGTINNGQALTYFQATMVRSA
jgi:hypothetical protein